MQQNNCLYDMEGFQNYLVDQEKKASEVLNQQAIDYELEEDITCFAVPV